MKIRSVKPSDYEVVTDIYNYYIEETTATFAEEKVDAAYFQNVHNNVKPSDVPFLVLENDNEIIGYAYAYPWRVRSAYRFSLETCIYIRHDTKSQGFGKKLYQQLIDDIASLKKYHLLIGGITLPNDASIGLHESLGYKKVAHFEEVGFKFERWLDVGYWQLKI